MARAVEILSGPTLTVEDDRSDYDEKRCITLDFLMVLWSFSSGHPEAMHTGLSV